jgi:hypothetical protein
MATVRDKIIDWWRRRRWTKPRYSRVAYLSSRGLAPDLPPRRTLAVVGRSSRPRWAVFASRKKNTSRDSRLDPSQVSRIVKKTAKNARLSGHVSPHWHRYSHAKRRGADLDLIKRTLRYASLSTTGRYVHAAHRTPRRRTWGCDGARILYR